MKRLAAICCLVPALGWCSGVVAKVDGEKTYAAELDHAVVSVLGRSGQDPADLSPAKMSALRKTELEELLLQKIIAKRAAESAADEAEVQRQRGLVRELFGAAEREAAALGRAAISEAEVPERLRASVRAATWLEAQVPARTFSEDELSAYYAANAARYSTPAAARASHILVLVEPKDTPEMIAEKATRAAALGDRVRLGEDFAQVARELSEDPTAKNNGGNLGWFTQERMPAEFVDAAFAMAGDEIRGPVRTRYGFHIIKLTAQKPAGQIPFEAARAEIGRHLADEHRRSRLHRLFANLRANARIEIAAP